MINEFKSVNLYTTKINDTNIIDLLLDNVNEYKPMMIIQHVTNDKLYIVLTKNVEIPYKHQLTLYVYDDIEQRFKHHQRMSFNIQPTKIDLNYAIEMMYNKYTENQNIRK